VVVSAAPEGENELRFTVRDTGIGIEAELLPTLYEDFVQVDSPLQKRLRGTGLGLSICKRFADLLGGRVEAESVVGEGSAFHVILPLQLTGPAYPAVQEPSSDA